MTLLQLILCSSLTKQLCESLGFERVAVLENAADIESVDRLDTAYGYRYNLEGVDGISKKCHRTHQLSSLRYQDLNCRYTCQYLFYSDTLLYTSRFQTIFSSLNFANIFADVAIFASYSSTDSVWFILTRCMILMID